MYRKVIMITCSIKPDYNHLQLIALSMEFTTIYSGDIVTIGKSPFVARCMGDSK